MTKKQNIMKNLIIIAALVIVATSSAFASKPATVKVVSKSHDLVYLKVSEDMIGAEIEIQDWTGKVIHTVTVTDKKVILDFYAEPSGEYTVIVKKNDVTTEIQYNKFTKSQASLADHNYMSVTQM